MSETEVRLRHGLYGFEMREVDRRRVDPKDRKTYNIKALWQQHHEIVNLAAKGFKGVEIAEILNIDPQTVSNTLNSELGQHKLSEIRQERDGETKKVGEKIRVLTSKALEVYHQIFDNKSGECSLNDKKKVADTVLLELSGLRVPTKLQAHHISTSLTAEELEEVKKRGIQAARESGLIIDIEPKRIDKGNGDGETNQ